jgi:hypothetical protein
LVGVDAINRVFDPDLLSRGWHRLIVQAASAHSQ